jgi:hypothetical protein
MNIKLKINLALGRMGYSLIRSNTLADLTRSGDTSSVAAPPADEVPSLPVVGPDAHLKLVPTVNAPPRGCTALAPKFDPAVTPCQLAPYIVEFQETGITIIPTNSDVAERWQATEAFDRDVGNRHSAWDWAGNSITPFGYDLRTGLPSTQLIEYLRTLFDNAEFDAFFRGVLGCPATVINCRLVKSVPHSGEGAGPQSWHHDGTPPGVIRGVMYLTHVDDKSGPFQYRDEAGIEHSVLGSPGDLLVFDAMRLMHRASPPERNERAAIDFVFMPRLPGQTLQIVVGGMNHWPADPFFYSVPNERNP